MSLSKRKEIVIQNKISEFKNENSDIEVNLESPSHSERGFSETYRAIEKRIGELDREYKQSSIENSRVIDGEILMSAPSGFFDRYREIVKSLSEEIQMNIASYEEKSNIIRESQENPTDISRQDRAFNVINEFSSDFIATKTDIKSPTERKIIKSMIVDEIIGFSIIGPLWRDNRIDEIICNGPFDVQVEIKGGLKKVPAAKFIDRDHLYRLLERLYRAINKQIAPKTPIMDGRLHDNSRIATVHHVAAPDGPLFSLRKHKEEYISPEKIIEWGTADVPLMTFLGNLVHKGGSILVIGGTGTGKTTLMGALSGFIREDDRVITIEDNIEIKLPKHKLLAPAMESIEAHPDAPRGGVSIRRLVKASLRLRPDAIIVGEVRDSAAYDLVQALNTGHYGMSTLHSNDEDDSIFRLSSLISEEGNITQESALPMIAAAFDVIIRIEKYPDGSRKISSVSEISPRVVQRNGSRYLPTEKLWEFVQDKTDDERNVKGRWVQLKDISEERQRVRGFRMYHDQNWETLKKLTEPPQ